MSAIDRKASRSGRKQRPKVEALTILEALYDLGIDHEGSWPFTVMEIATESGVSRNTASDRLLLLSGVGFLVTRRLRPLEHHDCRNAGPRPWTYTITRGGINVVLRFRAKRELLASEVDLETRPERFDRAAEILEAEAGEIEARIAKEPAVDPRQITLGVDRA